MKKKILTIALIVALAAVAIVGGTLAYFTDTKAADNTFTVGNVKIELLESSLHRTNAGVANGKESDSELWSDLDMRGGDGTFYTDNQIIRNAEKYDDGSGTPIKLNPGQSYHKMPYVLNTGNNDAYIRIRVMIPAALDTAILNSSMFTSSALEGEFVMTWPSAATNLTRDSVVYSVYTFTRNAPLAPDEMTYWNVWGTIHMDADVNNAEIEALFGTDTPFADGTFEVLVEADAIQADGFADVTAAFVAFDAQP